MAYEELDLSIFKECREAMKMDEFICNSETLDYKGTMNALTIGGERIDSHVLANGIHAISDLESHGIPVPNENATPEEIAKIQGYLFDCLVGRMEGHNIYQSVLLSAYVHKELELKNELLKVVVYSHIALVKAMETYISTNFPFSSNTWWPSSCEEIFHDVNVEELKAEIEKLEKTDTIRWAIFEIEMSEFLQGSRSDLPELAKFPEVSEPLGASKFLHYRDLPTTSPPHGTFIPTHEEAIASFTRTYTEMRESLTLSKPPSVVALLDMMCKWQVSHREASSFSRIFWYTRMFSAPEGTDVKMFGQMLSEFINAELTSIHVPMKIHTIQDGSCFAPNVTTFLMQFTRSCMANEATLHQYMVKSGLKYWAAIERLTVNLQMKLQKMQTFPKTNSDAMNSVVMTSLTLWSQRIALFLAINSLIIGFNNEIYNSDDFAPIFLTLSNCYKSLSGVIRDQRIVQGVYKHLPPKKPGKKQIARSLDVQKEVDVKTAEEWEVEIMDHFMQGAFHFMRYCLKTGSVKCHKGPFYDFANAYESRMKPFKEFYPSLAIPYANFQLLYNFENVSAAKLKDEVNKKWNAAKAAITEAQKAEKSPFLTTLLRTIVMSSIALMKHKEGDKFVIEFKEGIPCFQLQQ